MNESKQEIVIFGDSGYIGQNMAQALIKQSCNVCTVSRSSLKIKPAWKHFCWNAETVGEWGA